MGMSDEPRVHVVETITVTRWDHDCPALHGGACEPEVVRLYWVDGKEASEEEARKLLPEDDDAAD